MTVLPTGLGRVFNPHQLIVLKFLNGNRLQNFAFIIVLTRVQQMPDRVIVDVFQNDVFMHLRFDVVLDFVINGVFVCVCGGRHNVFIK